MINENQSSSYFERESVSQYKMVYPLDEMETRLNLIDSRIGDASDIFSRKFKLANDQINSTIEKINEDQLYQQEVKLLRKEEIDMLSKDAENYFQEEV